MSGEKTELPTPKKLRDAREKGQVALSKDIVHVGSLLLAFSVILFDVFDVMGKITLIMNHSFVMMGRPLVIHGILECINLITDLLLISLPILLVTICGGLAATFSQIGFLFSAEAIKPSFKRFDVVGNVKNIFSKKSFVQLLLSIFKIIVIGMISFLVLRNQLRPLMSLPSSQLADVGLYFVNIIRSVFYFSLLFFLILGILDYVVIRWQHMNQLKMSKHEVFQEYKEQEGDPHIKSHRKQMARELIESSPQELVAGSKAIVTNPTHIAVCLAYDPDVHSIPWVLAIKDGHQAQKIIQLALESGVPVIRHLDFARGLYRTGNERAYVPREYIKASALILKSVIQWYELDKEQRSRNKQWIMN